MVIIMNIVRELSHLVYAGGILFCHFAKKKLINYC